MTSETPIWGNTQIYLHREDVAFAEAKGIDWRALTAEYEAEDRNLSQAAEVVRAALDAWQAAGKPKPDSPESIRLKEAYASHREILARLCAVEATIKKISQRRQKQEDAAFDRAIIAADL